MRESKTNTKHKEADLERSETQGPKHNEPQPKPNEIQPKHNETHFERNETHFKHSKPNPDTDETKHNGVPRLRLRLAVLSPRHWLRPDDRDSTD